MAQNRADTMTLTRQGERAPRRTLKAWQNEMIARPPRGDHACQSQAAVTFHQNMRQPP